MIQHVYEGLAWDVYQAAKGVVQLENQENGARN
jgi:hypothetical protein